MKTKIETGNQVWLVPIRPSGDKSRVKLPRYITVDTVGKKWFTVKEIFNTRFSISEMMDEKRKYGYAHDYRVYLSKADHDAEIELRTLKNKIIEAVPKITIEQAKAILLILT